MYVCIAAKNIVTLPLRRSICFLSYSKRDACSKYVHAVFRQEYWYSCFAAYSGEDVKEANTIVELTSRHHI